MPSLETAADPSFELTVVVTGYEMGNWLREAVESVWASRPLPDEVLLIDDGSVGRPTLRAIEELETAGRQRGSAAARAPSAERRSGPRPERGAGGRSRPVHLVSRWRRPDRSGLLPLRPRPSEERAVARRRRRLGGDVRRRCRSRLLECAPARAAAAAGREHGVRSLHGSDRPATRARRL